MEEKEFTVDELIAFLTKLKTCGDYKIIIGERPLYTDEYAIAHDKKELIFRGCLYHEDINWRKKQNLTNVKLSIKNYMKLIRKSGMIVLNVPKNTDSLRSG